MEVGVREMEIDAKDLTACSGQRRLVGMHYHSCQTTA